VTGAELAREHRAALQTTRRHDMRQLLEAGISEETIAAAGPAIARIAVDGGIYQPNPSGAIAFLLPVRVEGPLTPEAVDPN
jgi:hypothetical protein